MWIPAPTLTAAEACLKSPLDPAVLSRILKRADERGFRHRHSDLVRFDLYPDGFFLGRTEIWTGVPSKSYSSRSLRSMNRM